MSRILISVEGQTEETFVRDVLAPHLSDLGVYVQPVVVSTKRPASGGKFRGGVNAWPPIRRELALLLGDTSADAVTTMFDLYALPRDVPGVSDTSQTNPEERVAHVEAAMGAAIGDHRFRAYVQLHEFEALVFSDPARASARAGNAAVGAMIEAAVQQAGGPELVNEHPTTAPSKRLGASWPGYVKTIDGPALTKAIGLDALANACSHFGAWLRWLESFGNRALVTDSPNATQGDRSTTPESHVA